MTAPLVQIDDLHIAAETDSGRSFGIINGVSITVAPGEIEALIGESGSGKTTIALGLLGHFRTGCHFVSGRMVVNGKDMARLSEAERAALRGRSVSYVAQSAAAAFNPSLRIIDQVIEIALIHHTLDRAAARARAVELFRDLGLPSPETIGDRYPHQVSGGQLQRLAAAMAVIGDPMLVIFDEPTTALDVTTQIGVLRAFKRLMRDKGMTGIYVSHDLAVVAQIADRITVLKNGEVQEQGTTAEILTNAQHPYTRDLLAAFAPRPRARPAAVAPQEQTIVLEGRNILSGYGKGKGFIPAVRDVSFRLPRGASLGVIGESGCGKSTLARTLAGLLPASDGQVILSGAPLPAEARARSKEELRRLQIVFQLADTALNPATQIGDILGRPLTFFHGMRGRKRADRVAELLDMVRLPRDFAQRYPTELSGGQKQRVNFARALAAEPEVILCDEITSALDTVVAAAVLDLLAELQRELGLSYLFISHDISTVRAFCDEVMVMYAGEAVDRFAPAQMDAPERHPYTRLLVSSLPQLDPGWLDSLPEVLERGV
ncbi:ABC transporter ATP-binding protein [Pseudooceanicola nanhaiensis]|uniref:ABC transporter ATP-binding protein n=1 Tax=Pseudooceanicola nanhaiensis TaxID=375761 RepID=UPI001CD63EB7|nr:ABC transporter ATP-binding protein [Pseudooceanicola nanhaiensis]MCA0920819.1 ABC transporter ATP-binding protein [Pseudooceanicola nanhaiensis]